MLGNSAMLNLIYYLIERTEKAKTDGLIQADAFLDHVYWPAVLECEHEVTKIYATFSPSLTDFMMQEFYELADTIQPEILVLDLLSDTIMGPSDAEGVADACSQVLELGLHAQNNYLVEQVVILSPFPNLQFFSRSDSEVEERIQQCDSIMSEMVTYLRGIHYHRMLTLRLDANGDPAPVSTYSTNRTIPGPGFHTEGFACYASEVASAIKKGA